MAKGSSILPLLLLLGGGYYVVTKHPELLPFNATGAARNLNVRIEGIHADADYVSMDVQVQNPNTQALEVQSFVGKMNVDGREVGEISMFGDYNVKGNSQMVIPLNVKPLINVYHAAMANIRKGSSRITFSGTINVNSHAIPLLISYTV